jgi:hypothetical protein
VAESEPLGSGPIRAFIAMFASAFTSQGLGPGLRFGWDALAIICLVCGVVLFCVSVFWNKLTRSIISSRLATSAIELGNDARGGRLPLC